MSFCRGSLTLSLRALEESLCVGLGAYAASTRKGSAMYGLIGRIRTSPGEGSKLAGILSGLGDMPGCLAYVAALDSSDPDLVWVTEVWTNREAHAASLELEAVQSAIAAGRSLIVEFEQRHETAPVGGLGLGVISEEAESR